MALAYRVAQATHEIETVADNGATKEIDLSLNGQVLIVVDYIDDQAPAVVLHTERFIVPASETTDAIAARINAYGHMVLTARTRATQLAQFVGTVVPVTTPVPVE